MLCHSPPLPYCVHSLIKCPFDEDLGQELFSVLNELEPIGLETLRYVHNYQVSDNYGSVISVLLELSIGAGWHEWIGPLSL